MATSVLTTGKFMNLMALELEVQIAQVAFDKRPKGCPVARTDALLKALKKAKQAVYDAVDELSPDEIREYGKYRLQEK